MTLEEEPSFYRFTGTHFDRGGALTNGRRPACVPFYPKSMTHSARSQFPEDVCWCNTTHNEVRSSLLQPWPFLQGIAFGSQLSSFPYFFLWESYLANFSMLWFHILIIFRKVYIFGTNLIIINHAYKSRRRMSNPKIRRHFIFGYN